MCVLKRSREKFRVSREDDVKTTWGQINNNQRELESETLKGIIWASLCGSLLESMGLIVCSSNKILNLYSCHGKFQIYQTTGR